MMLTITEVLNGRIITIIMNDNAVNNFVKKVLFVMSHILFFDVVPDSSDTCMLRASDDASATAIVRIPPIIASNDSVLEKSPVINPNVVITPDIIPNPRPLSWVLVSF